MMALGRRLNGRLQTLCQVQRVLKNAVGGGH
jgi:hypothetical protein